MLGRVAEVADEAGVKNLVNRSAIVDAALGNWTYSCTVAL
jgi:hypothetical protein